MQKIGGQNYGRILASQCRPGKPFQLITLRQSGESEVVAGEPKIARSVLSEGGHWPTSGCDRKKPIILQVADPGRGGNPDSPTRVLKKRSHTLIRHTTAGSVSSAPAGAVLAVHRNLALIQEV